MLKCYENASFSVCAKTRTEFGRWQYTTDAPFPTTGRCRVAQGNRLVEGVNGNVRALNMICDLSVVLDVDDRLVITMDDTGLAKSTQYAIIGIERSATLDRAVRVQKITLIEAALTVANNPVPSP